MAKLITILWRDIPAQILAKEKRTAHRIKMPGRFQTAIDRAAMIAGLEAADDYLEQWRQEVRDIHGDLQAEATKRADELGTAFPQERLDRYVANNGLAPEGDGTE